jgi:ketosteroid isomerase-like protein
MTTSHDTPFALVERYVAAFNARDLDSVLRLYEDDSVLVPVPGRPTSDRRAAVSYLMSLRQDMRAVVRDCFAAGDVALVVVEWAVGELSGVATDVVRFRGGEWRYLIDNPHGVAPAR